MYNEAYDFVANILINDLGFEKDEIPNNGSLKNDLGLDSLETLGLISSVENHFKIDFSEEEGYEIVYNADTTLDDFVILIAQKAEKAV